MADSSDYSSLSAALVLYIHRLISLKAGIGDVDTTPRPHEYTAAYNQLLRIANVTDDGRVPADPGIEATAADASEDHVMALHSAIQTLTEALREIEQQRKLIEEQNSQTLNLLDLITSQELTSKELHQAMLRFAEYRDAASRELARLTEQIDGSSETHAVRQQIAIAIQDRAIYDENWWSDRVVSLANMMAVQVQNEERTRRVPWTPRKDQDAMEYDGYEEEGTDDTGDRLTPEYGIDDGDEQEEFEEGGHLGLKYDEGYDSDEGESKEQMDLDLETLGIGSLHLDDHSTTRSTAHGLAETITTRGAGKKEKEDAQSGSQRDFKHSKGSGNSPEPTPETKPARLDEGRWRRIN